MKDQQSISRVPAPDAPRAVSNLDMRVATLIRLCKRLLAILVFPVLLAACCLLPVSLDLTASFRGRLAAVVDLLQGRYQVLGHGLPAPWAPEYARLLKERHGIEYYQAAWCLASDELIDYVDGYDSVSVDATKRKFGDDVFDKIADEARKRWDAEHPQNPL